MKANTYNATKNADFTAEATERLAGYGARAARAAARVGLFLAAPVIGLAYAVALPFVGIGMLAWVGVRAAVRR